MHPLRNSDNPSVTGVQRDRFVIPRSIILWPTLLDWTCKAQSQSHLAAAVSSQPTPVERRWFDLGGAEEVGARSLGDCRRRW